MTFICFPVYLIFYGYSDHESGSFYLRKRNSIRGFVSWSVGPSVRRSVGPSVRPSGTHSTIWPKLPPLLNLRTEMTTKNVPDEKSWYLTHSPPQSVCLWQEQQQEKNKQPQQRPQQRQLDASLFACRTCLFVFHGSGMFKVILSMRVESQLQQELYNKLTWWL